MAEFTQKLFSLRQRVELTYIHKLEVWLDMSYNLACGTCLYVEVGDAELVGIAIHQLEHARRNDVYSSKRELVAAADVEVLPRTFHLTSLNVCPPYQLHIVVEQEVALSLAVADEQHSIGFSAVLLVESE